MKAPKFTAEQEQQIREIQEKFGVTRKSAIRKMRLAEKAAAAEAAKATRAAKRQAKAPAEPKVNLSPEEVSRNRKEGIRLFQLAGKPTPEQFRLVYGERGPRMTWEERAAAGISAEQFQAALAAKMASR